MGNIWHPIDRTKEFNYRLFRLMKHLSELGHTVANGGNPIAMRDARLKISLSMKLMNEILEEGQGEHRTASVVSTRSR